MRTAIRSRRGFPPRHLSIEGTFDDGNANSVGDREQHWNTKKPWLISGLAALFLSFSLLIAPQTATPAHATGQLDTFCSNSWGTTVWTGRDPYACDGTLAGYIDGQFQGSVNIVRLIADNPPRTAMVTQ